MIIFEKSNVRVTKNSNSVLYTVSTWVRIKQYATLAWAMKFANKVLSNLSI